MSLGMILLIILILMTSAWTWGFARWDATASGLAAMALAPVLLLVSTIAAVRHAAPEPGGKRFIGAAVWHGFLYFAVPLIGMAIAIPSFVRNPVLSNQESALNSLRTINSAMTSYQLSYQHGFAPSLKVLASPAPSAAGGAASSTAPSCQAAGLIDDPLASGRKSGYIFEFAPGPPSENPPAGCPPGVTAYTVTANPQSSKQGQQHYFTDQTGVIRWTRENRSATAHDPSLGD